MDNKKNLEKVIITGGEGRVGKILRRGLKGYSLLTLDKKKPTSQNGVKIDIAREYKRLLKIFKGYDEVIHLAWDSKEDFPKESIIKENKMMAENIYRAAIKTRIKRVIMASSVHADYYSNWRAPYLISSNHCPWPDSTYGATKIYIENLGKYFSNKYSVQVICVRLGGINPKDQVLYKEDPDYNKVWLSRRDCISLFKKCIGVKKIPNFLILYGVSNNKFRVHSLSNSLGWQPQDGLK